MKRIRSLVLALLALLVLSSCSGSDVLVQMGLRAAPPPANIVMILTDDQDLLLGSMDYMPQTQALLADRGVTFSNFFVNLSLCCPARASLLRGQYPHNTGILSNLWPTGGFAKAYYTGIEQDTVATDLQRAGYRTALFGKYLNGYPLISDPTYIPPGWDEWWAPITDSAYGSYNYQVNHNGMVESYGGGPEDYITDVMAAQATAFISQTTALPTSQPFFVSFNVYAPHNPALAAPRHQGMFANVQAPRSPSFNEADLSDKPPFMQTLAELPAERIAQLDVLYRRRLQSLQAVDEAVAQLIRMLDAAGQLDNTYILFLSDNGYHLGQHRLDSGKGMPYEEDIHVPLIIRGPGVRKGAVVDELASIVDLAPTFAEIAGTEMTVDCDGRSLLPLLGTRLFGPIWRKAVLLEHYVAPSQAASEEISAALEPPDPGDLQREELKQELPDYVGMRTARYKYIQRVGVARELYDLKNDPYEMDNLWSQQDPQFQGELAAFMDALRVCAGEVCRALEEQDPPAWR